MIYRLISPSNFLLWAVLLFRSCHFLTPPEVSGAKSQSSNTDEALYRPKLHFTPKKNWMNDPNGMFYFNGKYHLYFQHYPDENVWGPMHWGHAISTDMVDWEEQPIALYPDEKGYIFSGSAVVDHNNTSGFGRDGKTPIIAVFTHHNMDKEKANQVDVETQSIAYSLDEGLTWTKYDGNPVIENPQIRNFRDPKVFWMEENQQWIMVLAAGEQVMFYGSPNLKDWTYLSAFGKGIGNHDGVWECPDLFKLRVEGTTSTKYVLLVSNTRNVPNSGSATQYFVGDFDGQKFTMDNAFQQTLDQEKNFWMDFGKDNYAGVRFQNIQGANGEKYLIGWMSNWEYATVVPTETWRSAMTIARKLSLRQQGDTYRLVSKPVENISAYAEETKRLAPRKVQKETTLITGKLFPSKIDLQFRPPAKGEVVFTLAAPNQDRLLFGFNAEANEFFIDRRASGHTDFSPAFANAISTAPRFSSAETITATVVLDKSSIEIFWDEGLTTMTETFFYRQPYRKMSLHSQEEIRLVGFAQTPLTISIHGK